MDVTRGGLARTYVILEAGAGVSDIVDAGVNAGQVYLGLLPPELRSPWFTYAIDKRFCIFFLVSCAFFLHETFPFLFFIFLPGPVVA